jgi:hypothetical protein
MGEREVAEKYAETHGLQFLGKRTLPIRSPWLGGNLVCVNAMSGRITGVA